MGSHRICFNIEIRNKKTKQKNKRSKWALEIEVQGSSRKPDVVSLLLCTSPPVSLNFKLT